MMVVVVVLVVVVVVIIVVVAVVVVFALVTVRIIILLVLVLVLLMALVAACLASARKLDCGVHRVCPCGQVHHARHNAAAALGRVHDQRRGWRGLLLQRDLPVVQLFGVGQAN
jgi:hypothetical protein